MKKQATIIQGGINMIKKQFLICTIISLLISICSVSITTAEEPTNPFSNNSISNAKAISLNKQYKIDYVDDVCMGSDFFVKFIIPNNGTIKLDVKIPYNEKSYGYEDMDIDVLDINGKKIQSVFSYQSSSQLINLGLRQGTYYINFHNESLIYEGSTSLSYIVSYSENNYCETEPNADIETANVVLLNTKYLCYTDSYYLGNGCDYFKFYVPTTQKLRFTVYNYVTRLGNKLAYVDIYDNSYMSGMGLDLFLGGFEWKSPQYDFNDKNSKWTISDDNAYIDKYLEKGIHYLKIYTYSSDPQIKEYSFKISTLGNIISNNSTNIKKSKVNNSNKTISIAKSKVSNIKIKNKSNKVTIKWKKVKNAVGYQVQVAKSNKFKKKILNKHTKKIKITFAKKKLKKIKKYYIRVRPYVKYNNGKSYGKWLKKKIINKNI